MASGTKNNDKKDRILDAAVRVFARNGFFNSKVSEIAKEANVADGTIYLYFKSKDDILISLFEEKMSQIILQMTENLRGVSDPREKLRICIRTHLEIMKENHDLAVVITVELRQSAKFMKEYDNRPFSRYLKILSDILQEGKQSRVFRADLTPGMLARALFGMLDELSLWLVMGAAKNKVDWNKAHKELTEFFLRAVSPGEPTQQENSVPDSR